MKYKYGNNEVNARGSENRISDTTTICLTGKPAICSLYVSPAMMRRKKRVVKDLSDSPFSNTFGGDAGPGGSVRVWCLQYDRFGD